MNPESYDNQCNLHPLDYLLEEYGHAKADASRANQRVIQAKVALRQRLAAAGFGQGTFLAIFE